MVRFNTSYKNRDYKWLFGGSRIISADLGGNFPTCTDDTVAYSKAAAHVHSRVHRVWSDSGPWQSSGLRLTFRIARATFGTVGI
jgi:hypothetical protein